ncbi:hypothetical protein FrEUN1fDRAFT_7191 [Parafrankia sp. EUN1f]|nr:hypothetical protein FrEUN1fDRAFT_7191 [Parafrankia sp. EUN1f]
MELTRQEAESASGRIAADDELHAVHDPAISSGDEARARLRQLIRQRVAAAVGESALLPRWLNRAVGYSPPSGQKGAAWMDTAASIAAYRVTYDVTDPVDALGAPPRTDQRGQHAWYEDLREQLRALAL